MDELLAWAEVSPERHFTVSKRGTCRETRWRVAVWEKPEGEVTRGIPGEGYGQTCEEAVRVALGAWFQQTPMARKVTAFWYVHPYIGDKLGGNYSLRPLLHWAQTGWEHRGFSVMYHYQDGWKVQLADFGDEEETEEMRAIATDEVLRAAIESAISGAPSERKNGETK